jgi:nucleoside-diphosphate-sugar epimerase
MTGELVLVTGASGHIGFRVVFNALEAGYHVRAAVRNQVKADTILTAPSMETLAPGKKLTFVFVPDMLADGAFDEAVKDVTYIIHTASPLPAPSDDYERDLVQPAVNGTTGILKSALMNPTVKRIVITSSMGAVIPWKYISSEESDRVFTADDRIADPHPPFTHPAEAYCASKVRALNATDKFVETEKPHFEVSNVMPSFCIGKNELITDAKYMLSGSNNTAFAHVLGRKSDFPMPGFVCHVDDAAKVHVLALGRKIEGNQNFGLASDGVAGIKWNDSIRFAKKHFPQAVKDGRLPADGAQRTHRLLVDASKTDEILGIKQRNYEEAVTTVVEHYLELLEKTGGKVEVGPSLGV